MYNIEMLPPYVDLIHSGKFEKRLEKALSHLTRCDCCPNNCGVNRAKGEVGICKTGFLAQVSSYGPHHGEEYPLSGWCGSGTIFFTYCNMHCVYCQNYDISQIANGHTVDSQQLADIMLYLQKRGCHNINLVSPTHVVPQILSALLVAVKEGLNVPIVYNTGGYDSHDIIQLLDGIIDIYMPDMKYADKNIAYKYSQIHNYPVMNQEVIREMHRQVGDLRLDEFELAYRGLLIRHLVLPNELCGTKQIVNFLANEISQHTYINLMDQYRPEYLANRYSELNRPASPQELYNAKEMALEAGLYRLD